MSFKRLIIGAGTALLLATSALAHSPISQSNIVAGTSYETAPESFDFGFSKAVGLAKVSLTTQDGKTLALDYTKPKSMQKAFSIPLPQLSDDAYIISWSAVASDGHVMKGEISFSVGTVVSEKSSEPEAHSGH